MSCDPTDTCADGAYRMPAWLVEKLRAAPEVAAGLAENGHHGRWASSLALLDAFIAREGHARVPQERIEGGIKLGAWVGKNRERRRAGALSGERVAALESRIGWVWDPQEQSYADGLAALDAFIAREGHARVPRERIEDGIKLGTWVGKNREQRRAGALSGERVSVLESRIGWAWDAQAASFTNGLAALDAFISKTGHARIPRAHIEDGFALGEFVQRNRRKHARGDLLDERVTIFESKAGWTWNEQDQAFADGLAVLDAFILRTGHARVLLTHLEGEFKLGTWAGTNRKKWKAGRLPSERAAVLEARPGWVWEPHEQSFSDGLEALDLFIAATGHAQVPVRRCEGELNLGQWVKSVQIAKQRGKLTDSRIAALESRAGWVWMVRGRAMTDGATGYAA